MKTTLKGKKKQGQDQKSTSSTPISSNSDNTFRIEHWSYNSVTISKSILSYEKSTTEINYRNQKQTGSNIA